MPIRLKFFIAFSVVVAMACGLAAYGIRNVNSSGDRVVRLYDGPLMGVNHAQAAHAALDEARLLMRQMLGDGASDETVARFGRLRGEIRESFRIVRERVADRQVRAALERAEDAVHEWAESGKTVFAPPDGGLTALPAPFVIARKGKAAAAAVDDLVQMVAAYGFAYRMDAQAQVAGAFSTMLWLAVGTAFVGIAISFAFSASMSRPISAAMALAERVAAGDFVDRIEAGRRDELGRLLRSLGVMQDRLRSRAERDAALKRVSMALSETNEALLRAKSREELFATACEAAGRGGGFAATVIAMAREGGEYLTIAAAAGAAAGVVDDATYSVNEASPKGRSLFGRAFRAGTTVCSDNRETAAMGEAAPVAAAVGAGAAVAVPLFGSAGVVGVMGFMSTDVGAFTPEMIQVIERLAQNVSFALASIERAEEKRVADERIGYMAAHDGMTGLPNRSTFSQHLAAAIGASRRHGREFAVMFIDLDRFKVINDTLGHGAGDALIVEVGRRIRAGLRVEDFVARLGGDEFVVVLGETGRDGAARVAETLLAAVGEPIVLCGHECRTSASIGVAMYPQDGLDEQALTKNADMAMYLAKEEGKNGYRFYEADGRVQSIELLTLESGLRGALDQGQFELHYQPKIDLATGQLSGIEALIRWNHPDKGSVSPAQFVPIAEETGMIVPIGRWVLREACRQNMEWQEAGLPPLTVAVNLSPRQFSDPNLLADIDAALADSGMAAEMLQLEITESTVMRNVDRAIALLDAIKARGVRLAIDDFGTGYSSMALLKRFPVDTLKIDRSFVKDLPDDQDDVAIAQAIISMAKALGLTVVAEGVETDAQRAFLEKQACDEIQGYLFSRPLPAAGLAALLRERPDPAPLQPDQPAGAARLVAAP